MKANKAPEKIYVPTNSLLDSGLEDFYVGHRTFDEDVEYIRTDAFIEKVCDWLKENAGDYVVHHWNETMLDTMSLIENFKNYIKEK